MLNELIKELREMAVNLGVNGVRTGDLSKLCVMLREAADTIESLRKQVAKCQITELKADYDTSRYFELFGTPERAARTLVNRYLACNAYGCDHCPFEIMGHCPEDDNLDTLLEWLKSDVE